MPKKTKVTTTIFARGVEHLADTINAIDSIHGIPPAELTRRLLEAACKFYRENGWFSFPIIIEPEEFQRRNRYPTKDEIDEAARNPKPPGWQPAAWRTALNEDAPPHGLNTIGGNQTRSSEPDAEKKRSGKSLPPRK